MISEKLIKDLKEKLEKEKGEIEKDLSKFAKKDKNLKGDWDTRFPHWDGGSGSSALERAADQVEEYGNLLSLEYKLETRLKEIDLALEKINPSTRLRVDAEHDRSINQGIYGKCENCSKEIKEERLRVYPAARLCLNCEKK